VTKKAEDVVKAMQEVKSVTEAVVSGIDGVVDLVRAFVDDIMHEIENEETRTGVIMVSDESESENEMNTDAEFDDLFDKAEAEFLIPSV
jgi:hypothetical protein